MSLSNCEYFRHLGAALLRRSLCTRLVMPILLLLVVAAAPAPALRVRNHSSVVVLNLTSLDGAEVATSVERAGVWDRLMEAAALQGLVNRHRPQLYLLLNGNNGKIDRFWLARMQHENWPPNAKYTTTSSVSQALRLFRRYVHGVVVWDPNVPATANAAFTCAGVDDLLPVRFDTAKTSLYWQLTNAAHGPHLPVKEWLVKHDGEPRFTGTGLVPGTHTPSCGSAKCDVYLWAAAHFLKTGRCRATVMGYYPDGYWITHNTHLPVSRALLSNRDYSVANRAFCFDLSPWADEEPIDDPHQPLGTDYNTLRAILRDGRKAAARKIITVDGFTPWDEKYTDFTGGKHGGVATEWRYAEILSCFNACMDADAPGLDSMANASFYQHFPLKQRYAQPALPTVADLRTEGLLTKTGMPRPFHYVAVYMGDYDSSAWFYQMVPGFWADANRGKLPIGWAFDPNLADRFPFGMNYVRTHASANDYFIAGDSGAGYLNPGYLVPPRKWSGLPSGLSAWQKRCEKYYQQWDLGITGFVIDGNAPPMSATVMQAYTRFSKDGVVAQKIPPVSMVRHTPFIRMSSDLPHNSAQAAAVILGDNNGTGPTFKVYRAILWSPTDLLNMVSQLSTNQRIRYVDPYTLFLLAKLQMENTVNAVP